LARIEDHRLDRARDGGGRTLRTGMKNTVVEVSRAVNRSTTSVWETVCDVPGLVLDWAFRRRCGQRLGGRGLSRARGG
jgi:hypothetical protein